jgi:hypothetical protein
MTSSRDLPGKSQHPLLQDLLPRDESQESRFAEVMRTLGVHSGGAGMQAADGREELLVHRRTLPVLTTQLAGSLPTWASGLRAERTIGPIRDHLGRDTFFDIFRRVRQVRFVRAAGAAPFVAVPLSQFSVSTLASGATTFNLAAGSFWIATRLLAAAAEEGVYTGLRIAGGSFRFDQPVSVSGDEVVVPAGAGCRIVLQLEAPAAPTGTGAGRDLRDALFQPPKSVAITIAGTNATLTVETPSALRVYGQEVELDPLGGAPVYLPQFNRLRVPLAPRVAQFAASTVRSVTLQPQSSAPITGAGWALPAARIAAADLGEASGVGALMLELGPGLSATWPGQATTVPLGPTLLLLDEARLAIVSAAAHGYATVQRPQFPEAMGRGRVTFDWNHTFPITYFAQADGTEALFTVAGFRASLETPVDVRGDRVALDVAAAAVVFLENADGRFLWAFAEMPLASGSRGLAFGLKNAILRASPPLSFSFLAAYDGVDAGKGVLAIGYALVALFPSLPDPYAINAGKKRPRALGGLVSFSSWTPASAQLDFVLPSDWELPTATFNEDDPGSAVGLQRNQQSVSAPAERSGCLGLGRLFASRDTGKRFDPATESPGAEKALGDMLTFEHQPRLILLDLSTKVSQFGVALRAPVDQRRTFSVAPFKPMAVQGLDLAVDGRLMVLLTVPAVQWEAVKSEPVPDDPAFPPHLRFANSGVPTLVDVPTVNLVPVTPEAALTSIVSNFAEPDPRPARARFTLPFGMIASAVLQKAGPGRGARVTEPRPSAGDGLRAIRQLRIDAADPSLAASGTPALPGFTVQLPVAIPTDGSPGPRSILGTSMTNIFNGYVGRGGTSELVPVTRIDLSGFGESLFSGWINPTDDETQVAKADFKVLIGRTAHEVVQVRSILLPYHVPVVRTVTLERKNNAIITRYDSGWIAAGDGVYRFRPGSGIVTHPGAVRGITNVTQIRETGDRITKNGIEFAAVYYQGNLALDGAARPVPVAHHFGYVKIGTVNLTAATYAALLAEAGPLGGPLDTTIAIGGGAQAMRLHRVGVGATQTGDGPEFVMTAWGALVFPGGGDWSVLQASDATGAPQPVPKDEGLPLIRAGAAGGPSVGPYRFADPADLAREGTPARDYGILHSTGTQRAFFRRPKIEAADLARIVSTQRPVIADPYVLATALGPFPPQSAAIPFPSASWALAVGAGGDYKLEAAPSFPAGIGRRTMRQSGSVKSDLDYGASVVTYEVDTAQPVPWRFGLTNAARIMNTPALGDMITLTANIAAEAGRETVFNDPRLKLGGALSIVQDLLTILAELGIVGVLRTAMTNEWSFHASLKVPCKDSTGADLQAPPRPDPLPAFKLADTGFTIEVSVAPKGDKASFELAGRPSFAIKSVPHLYVVAIIQFKIELSTEQGTTYEVFIGIGFSYEIEAEPFEFEGLLAITFFVVWGDTILGYGVGFLVELSASIKPIVSVELSLEGRLARIVVHNGLPDETVFCAAKLTFAVEVSIFLVLSISFELETQEVTTLRGPLPVTALPDIL